MQQVLVNSALAADTARTIVAQHIYNPSYLILFGMFVVGITALMLKAPQPHPFHKSYQGPFSD